MKSAPLCRAILSLKRLVAAALILSPLAAPAWDPAGHMLVDQIAWTHVQPATRQRVEALVKTVEATYNEKQPYNFVTAGCWMDDMRSKKGYAWSKWHYVDIAYTPSGYPCALPKEGPNVVWAIGENLKTLHNRAATPEQIAEALVMLMHFVGDVHQPLHAAEWNDRGGNGYLTHGVPFTDLFRNSVANLHTFWDKAFRFDGVEGKNVELWTAPDVAARPTSPTEGVIAEQAAKIMTAFPPESLWQLQEKGGAAAWACESHLVACLAAYPDGPHPGNAEVVELSSLFVHDSEQIAQSRVALAGYRLAQLLDEIFPAGVEAPVAP